MQQSEATTLLLPAAEPAPTRRSRLVSTLSLVVIGFFWVSGGIYGSEELISAAPPGIVLAWTAGAALLFALPNALMTAECAAAFPIAGGQVAWVAMACGETVGGHNGYWVWLTNLLDAAVYPQMAAQYLVGALPSLSEGARELVGRGACIGVIALVCAVNLLGLECVTTTQAVAFAGALLPCVLFSASGLSRIHVAPLTVTTGDVDLALLISWAVWLYSGFSSLGAMAGEVHNPQRTYPTVVALLVPLVTLLNLLPFAVALSIDPDTSHYQAGYFATLAGDLAGPWLHSLFAAGANVSLLGLYHSQMLAAERALVAWGEGALVAHGWSAGFRPPAVDEYASSTAASSAASSAAFAAPPSAPSAPSESGGAAAAAAADLSPPPKRTAAPPWAPVSRLRRWLLSAPNGSAVPRLNTIFNAAIAAGLTQLHYTSLVEVEMMLYAVSHTLFLYAFSALRWQQPDVPRPFRLPGGISAAAAASLLPLCVCIAVLASNVRHSDNLVAFLAVMMAGALGHAVGRFLLRRCPRRADAGSSVLGGAAAPGRDHYERVP